MPQHRLYCRAWCRVAGAWRWAATVGLAGNRVQAVSSASHALPNVPAEFENEFENEDLAKMSADNMSALLFLIQGVDERLKQQSKLLAQLVASSSKGLSGSSGPVRRQSAATRKLPLLLQFWQFCAHQPQPRAQCSACLSCGGVAGMHLEWLMMDSAPKLWLVVAAVDS